MIAHFLNVLFDTAMQWLPWLFVLGAPVLLLMIAMAALLDARLHLTDDHPVKKSMD